MWTHLGTIKARDHEVRFVFDLDSYGGVYSPEIHVYLVGPNDSRAGRGPKGWPTWLRFGNRETWSDSLAVPVPHLTWRRAYKLRRYGALRLYKVNYRLLHAIARRYGD